MLKVITQVAKSTALPRFGMRDEHSQVCLTKGTVLIERRLVRSNY